MRSVRVTSARLTAARRAARRLSTAAAAPAAAEGGLTVFQKACVAAGGVGAVGAAGFGYLVHRVSSNHEFRVWLHRDQRFVADYVEQWMTENMPQTAKAIRIEEDILGEGAPALAAAPAAHISKAHNLGAAPALPELTEGGKRFFTQLEQQPEPIDATAKQAEGLPGPGAIGVQMPSAPVLGHDGKPWRAGLVEHVDMVEDAPAIAPDDPELPDGDALDGGAAWGAEQAGGLGPPWHTLGAPPEQSARLLVPERAAGRFEGRLLEYEAIETRLRGDDAALLEAAAAAKLAARGATAAPRVIELPARFRDGVYGTLEAEGDVSAKPHDSVRALRLQWLRVQEAFAEAEEASLAPRAAQLEAAARRGGGGGAAHLRILERQRKLAQVRAVLRREKAEVKRSPTLSQQVADPFPLNSGYVVQRGV